MMPENKCETAHIATQTTLPFTHSSADDGDRNKTVSLLFSVRTFIRHIFMNFVLGFMLISTSAMLQVTYSVTAKIQVTVNINFNMP
jgi:hypothetical protein